MMKSVVLSGLYKKSSSLNYICIYVVKQAARFNRDLRVRRNKNADTELISAHCVSPLKKYVF